MAEVAIPRNLSADILRMIAELRPQPSPGSAPSTAVRAARGAAAHPHLSPGLLEGRKMRIITRVRELYGESRLEAGIAVRDLVRRSCDHRRAASMEVLSGHRFLEDCHVHTLQVRAQHPQLRRA